MIDARLSFWGHAAFVITWWQGGRERTLAIDPYPADGWGGRLNLRPIRDRVELAIVTHDHPDHDGTADLTQARVIRPPFRDGDLTIANHKAAHDQFGGRLRGGLIDVLRITVAGHVIVHCGDLGERPTGALLAWLREVPIDALLVPVGGYYTLGGDGAAQLVHQLQPRVAIPYHSANDGLADPRLDPVDHFLRRFSDVGHADELSFGPDAARPASVTRLRAKGASGQPR